MDFMDGEWSFGTNPGTGGSYSGRVSCWPDYYVDLADPDIRRLLALATHAAFEDAYIASQWRGTHPLDELRELVKK